MGSQSGGYYRTYIPEIGLSIEKNTGNVPSDGKFYIVKTGTILESFRSRKLAEEKFRQIVRETGFKPNATNEKQESSISESDDRYAISKAIFWAEGAKFRQKGGRGR
jgi:hypothetical protein